MSLMLVDCGEGIARPHCECIGDLPRMEGPNSFDEVKSEDLLNGPFLLPVMFPGVYRIVLAF